MFEILWVRIAERIWRFLGIICFVAEKVFEKHSSDVCRNFNVQEFIKVEKLYLLFSIHCF